MEVTKPIIWSYGGGTQSIAIALLIAQGRLPKPSRIIFADTGREAAETFSYTEQYVAPLLATLGLTIETAPHTLATVDLYSKKSRKLLIPAFSATTKLPTYCSSEWKKYVVRRYLVANGFNARTDSLVLWMGISTDEVERLKPSDVDWIEHHWPLCGMPVSAHYDVSFSRAQCYLLIEQAGWPAPPKSACWMCPNRTMKQWHEMKVLQPADFAQAVVLERSISAENMKTYGVPLYLTKTHTPLDQIDFSAASLNDEFESACDTGFCFT